MNKTILTTTLALGLGVTGLAGHSADASEQTINKAELAQLALNNAQVLNDAPIENGTYDYEFDYNGYHFDFESNGSYWKWEYHATGKAAPVTQNVQQSYSAPKAAVSAPVQQAPVQQQSAPVRQAPTYHAPVQQAQPAVQSTGSNVQVNDHLKLIAQRESGGNLKAINPTSGAAGKYQFLQTTWDSVAPAGWVGKSPASAPESIQDAAAVKLYNTAGPSQWVTAY